MWWRSLRGPHHARGSRARPPWSWNSRSTRSAPGEGAYPLPLRDGDLARAGTGSRSWPRSSLTAPRAHPAPASARASTTRWSSWRWRSPGAPGCRAWSSPAAASRTPISQRGSATRLAAGVHRVQASGDPAGRRRHRPRTASRRKAASRRGRRCVSPYRVRS